MITTAIVLALLTLLVATEPDTHEPETRSDKERDGQ
jgi:hypothetical protein